MAQQIKTRRQGRMSELPTSKLTSIEDRIESGYDSLSARLRTAADFIAQNPVDFATRSLRSVAGQTGLAPATFTRLSRALGFDGYEDMREVARAGISRSITPFSERAGKLQADAMNDNGKQQPFLMRQSNACIDNITRMAQTTDTKLLDTVVDRLLRVDHVTLVGALGSAPFADYCSYLANWFVEDWSVTGKTGLTHGSSITKANGNHGFLIICKQPFVHQSLRIAELAAENGAYIVIITDSRDCPALKYSDAGFILPSESPQFFPSYAATLVFIETLIGMLVARAGPDAKERIATVELNNRRMEEFWDS